MTTKAELLKVIRRECINCMGGYIDEVSKCTTPKCELFDYRMGKDPRPNKNKVRMGEKFGFKPSVDRENINENQRQGLKA